MAGEQKKQPKRWCMLIGMTLCLVMSILCLIVLLRIDSIISMLAAKKAKIVPGTQLFESWKKPSVPIYFSIYVYNITNKEEVINGSVPVLEELGPFVYRQERIKEEIEFYAEDGSRWIENESDGLPTEVSYRLRKTYHFLPELSKYSQDVNVSTLNVVMTSGAASDYWMLSFLYKSKKFTNFFVTVPVKDFIWGYSDEALAASMSGKKNGIMANKNGTLGDKLRIKTGVSSAADIGQFVQFRDLERLDIWSSNYSNEIAGTDGTIAAPGLYEGQKLRLFVPDLCRSMYTTYQKTVSSTNSPKIDLFAFSAEKYDMANKAINPMNAGFCPDGECPPDGLIDLSKCKEKSSVKPPIFASAPHFLGADPKIRASFKGIPEPDPVNDRTVTRLEPLTGLLIEASKKLQFNMLLKPEYKYEPKGHKITEARYYPLMWIHESVTADEKALTKIYTMVHAKRQLLIYIVTVVLALCVIVFLLTLAVQIYFAYFRQRGYMAGAEKETKPDIKHMTLERREEKNDELDDTKQAFNLDPVKA